MLLGFASVTDALVTFATHVIRDLGLAGILLMIGSSGVIGVPGTELPMLFAGFNVYEHHLTLLGVIVFGVLGDTIGASIAYAIGYYGRRELLERHGGKLHVTPARLATAERWFQRRGTVTIPLSRMIPVARAAFPYAAGVSRVPFARFVLLATLGSIPWIAGLAILGRAVGSNWESWRRHLEYVDYAALAVVVLAVAYLIVRRARSRSDKPTPDAVA
ncbi:MAG TPA: DedA family protein [Solirubrobacteraceae bacterium]|nr:DedA family protein [Solirubrobacteraceae bacterium]